MSKISDYDDILLEVMQRGILFTDAIVELEQLVEIASSEGNFDANEYLFGMANGMILALSIIKNTDCNYLTYPKKEFKMLDEFKMLGKVIVLITGTNGDDEMTFVTEDGARYQFYHVQDCCEYVYITDVIGDVNDLIGEVITQAEVVSNPDAVSDMDNSIESCTWTFYKFATIKGSVTVRWLGTSNGYHSEIVDFKFIPSKH